MQVQGCAPGRSDGGGYHHHRGRLFRGKGGGSRSSDQGGGGGWRPSSSRTGDRDYFGSGPEASNIDAYDALQDTSMPVWMWPSCDWGPLPACSSGPEEKGPRGADLGRQSTGCERGRRRRRRIASAAGPGGRASPRRAARAKRGATRAPGYRGTTASSWRGGEQKKEEKEEGQEGGRLLGRAAGIQSCHQGFSPAIWRDGARSEGTCAEAGDSSSAKTGRQEEIQERNIQFVQPEFIQFESFTGRGSGNGWGLYNRLQGPRGVGEVPWRLDPRDHHYDAAEPIDHGRRRSRGEVNKTSGPPVLQEPAGPESNRGPSPGVVKSSDSARPSSPREGGDGGRRHLSKDEGPVGGAPWHTLEHSAADGAAAAGGVDSCGAGRAAARAEGKLRRESSSLAVPRGADRRQEGRCQGQRQVQNVKRRKGRVAEGWQERGAAERQGEGQREEVRSREKVAPETSGVAEGPIAPGSGGDSTAGMNP